MDSLRTPNSPGEYAELFFDIDTFDRIYEEARELELAEKSGDTQKLSALDFGLPPLCNRCLEPFVNKRQSMKCSACQAVVYCSRECQTADWKKSNDPSSPPHKRVCKLYKAHMERIPVFRRVFKQFAWARIEPDGSCSHHHLKAHLGVLGPRPSFGYWSTPGGIRPHDIPASVFLALRDPEFMKSVLEGSHDAPEYIDGEILLGTAWPSDIDAWKLKDESHIPRLSFTDQLYAPPETTPGRIKDWLSWYDWRGLTLASPAALLLDFPLSVFYLLDDVLGVVDPERSPIQRQTLDVHYVGAEIELNFLPLFSELALLLPNDDVIFTLFGKSVYDLVRRARESYPGSLATQDIVWSYTAPANSGGGTIQVKLWSESDEWSGDVTAHSKQPDALLGLNASLRAYKSWEEVMFLSVMFDIPFGVTEYTERGMEDNALWVANFCEFHASHTSKWAKLKVHGRPITVNPFHRPGQRANAEIKVPDHYNGFAMPIIAHARRQ